MKDLKSKNVHIQSGLGVDMVIKSSLVRKTLDNVTCVVISFSNFEKLFKQDEFKSISPTNLTTKSSYVNTETDYHKKGSLDLNLVSNKTTHNKDREYSSSNINSNSNYKSTIAEKNRGVNYLTHGLSMDLMKPKQMLRESRDFVSKKVSLQKKLVSLDISNKKQGVGYSLMNNKSDKEFYSNKKRLDFSENMDKDKEKEKKTPNYLMDNYPSTTKNNYRTKEGNPIISSIKKIQSYKGLMIN